MIFIYVQTIPKLTKTDMPFVAFFIWHFDNKKNATCFYR